VWTAACHHRFICQNGSKSIVIKPAEYFAADFALWSCHRHGLAGPTQQFCLFQHTTKQTHTKMQLSLAAEQQQ